MPKDFSHQDLRGRSFRNQDLTGADFSHADIRGTNFKGAILKRANFAHAKGGLPKTYFSEFTLIFISLSATSGILSVFSGSWLSSYLKHKFQFMDYQIILFISLYFLAYAFISLFTISKYKYNILTIITILLIGLGLSVNMKSDAVNWFVGAILTVIGTLPLAMAMFIEKKFTIILTIVVAVLFIKIGDNPMVILVVITIQILLAYYISYKTYQENEQFEIIKEASIFLSSLFGTDFDGVDLADANFNKANLKYCRFSKEAIILRTGFKNAENLKFARLTGTILENKAVRELLVTGNGKNQSYAGMNLKGAYLVGADLSGADFHEADLIGATLENANLRDANLSRIQALNVEFRGADLTGACLEAWNIDSTTQLDGAYADFVYLLSNKLERRPASGNFGEGEFAKLFNEVLDTVDFIFRNGIDWQAFMICYEKCGKNQSGIQRC
ncbi:MAG: pentapeptide repeat-containing protein [Desulfobacteraceae bacterium]|nr:pentapeptide repeat-containing protein [Desulfobacteraceae bacterium]